MTNISKQPLDPKTETQLRAQFNAFFEKSAKMNRKGLYTALFTPAEQIMFVKRLAIILLLSRKCPTHTISELLLVSDATVRTVRTLYLKGQYDAIIDTMGGKRFNGNDLLKIIETLLQAGLPPRGRGRWKWLYEMEDEPTLRKWLKAKNISPRT